MVKIRRRPHFYSWTFALALLQSCGVWAQSPQNDGTFVLVCQFYGESHQGASAWNKTQKCALPPDFPLDVGYQQQILQPEGGGAKSDLTNADVPPGLHVVVDGGHYWAATQTHLAFQSRCGRAQIFSDRYLLRARTSAWAWLQYQSERLRAPKASRRLWDLRRLG